MTQVLADSDGNFKKLYTFTGQWSHVSDFGLMYYGARWYDPVLGRFAQADTLVPEPGNPMAFDRYTYTYNNPVRYVDPSGHISCLSKYALPGECSDDVASPGQWIPFLKTKIYREFGVTISDEIETWNFQNLKIVYRGLGNINQSLGGNLNKLVRGSATFYYKTMTGGYSGWTADTTIIFKSDSLIPYQNLYHEVGHLIDNLVDDAISDHLGMEAHFIGDDYMFGGNMVDEIKPSVAFVSGIYISDPNPERSQVWSLQAIGGSRQLASEQWADMFANYVAGNIDTSRDVGMRMYTWTVTYLYIYTGKPIP